jgi:hypothetical protein
MQLLLKAKEQLGSEVGRNERKLLVVDVTTRPE